MASNSGGSQPLFTPGMEFDVQFGDSWRGGSSSFCALRYDFIAASVDTDTPAKMVCEDNKVRLHYQDGAGSSGEGTIFQGNMEVSKDSLDCVLIFDGNEWKLELLSGLTNNLRTARSPARTPLRDHQWDGEDGNNKSGEAPAQPDEASSPESDNERMDGVEEAEMEDKLQRELTNAFEGLSDNEGDVNRGPSDAANREGAGANDEVLQGQANKVNTPTSREDDAMESKVENAPDDWQSDDGNEVALAKHPSMSDLRTAEERSPDQSHSVANTQAQGVGEKPTGRGQNEVDANDDATGGDDAMEDVMPVTPTPDVAISDQPKPANSNRQKLDDDGDNDLDADLEAALQDAMDGDNDDDDDEGDEAIKVQTPEEPMEVDQEEERKPPQPASDADDDDGGLAAEMALALDIGPSPKAITPQIAMTPPKETVADKAPPPPPEPKPVPEPAVAPEQPAAAEPAEEGAALSGSSVTTSSSDSSSDSSSNGGQQDEDTGGEVTSANATEAVKEAIMADPENDMIRDFFADDDMDVEPVEMPAEEEGKKDGSSTSTSDTSSNSSSSSSDDDSSSGDEEQATGAAMEDPDVEVF